MSDKDPRREAFMRHYDRNGWRWEWHSDRPIHVQPESHVRDMALEWTAWLAAHDDATERAASAVIDLIAEWDRSGGSDSLRNRHATSFAAEAERRIRSSGGACKRDP